MRNESAFESPGKALRLRALGMGLSVFARGGFAVLDDWAARHECGQEETTKFNENFIKNIILG